MTEAERKAAVEVCQASIVLRHVKKATRLDEAIARLAESARLYLETERERVDHLASGWGG